MSDSYGGSVCGLSGAQSFFRIPSPVGYSAQRVSNGIALWSQKLPRGAAAILRPRLHSFKFSMFSWSIAMTNVLSTTEDLVVLPRPVLAPNLQSAAQLQFIDDVTQAGVLSFE